jgi:peroxiredoxin
VNFVGVFFEKDRDKVRQIVAKHSWRFTLAVDPDGAVTNAYSIGGCPTTVLAERGGRVRETLVGELDHRALGRHVRALVR